MKSLQDLITGARQLADDPVGPVWETDGARACPIGWLDCSQPVFYSAAHDVYDYGERGGPADKDCRANCSHGYQPAPEEEEELDPLSDMDEFDNPLDGQMGG